MSSDRFAAAGWQRARLAVGRSGWAAVRRTVSWVHLSGERGRPAATLDLLAPHLSGGDVQVLLGPSAVTCCAEPTARGADESTPRRVPVHSSGARLSSHVDVRPAGDPARDVGRRLGADDDARAPSRALWHRSPGSPG